MKWDAVITTMAGAAALCLCACEGGSSHPTRPGDVDKVDEVGNQPLLLAISPAKIVGFSSDGTEKAKATAPDVVTLAEKLRAQRFVAGAHQLFALARSKTSFEVRVFASPGQLAKDPVRTIPTAVDSAHHATVGFAHSRTRDAALIVARAEDGTYALHVQPLGSPEAEKREVSADASAPLITDAQLEAIEVADARRLENVSYDDGRDVLYAIAKAPFQPSVLPKVSDKYALLRISRATAESPKVDTLPLEGLADVQEVGASTIDEEKDRLLLIADGQLVAVENASGDGPTVKTFDWSLGEKVDAVKGAELTIQFGKRFLGTSMVVDATARRVWISAIGAIAGFSLDDESLAPLVLKAPGLVSSLVLFDAGRIDR